MFSILHSWDLSTSYLYFSGFSTLCLIFVTHKMLKLKFGWFFILINLYNFSAIIIHGNMHSFILLLSLYPLGSLFSTAIKPFYFVIPVLFYFTKNKKIIRKIGILWLIVTAFILVLVYPSKEVLTYVLKHNDLVNRCVLLSINIYFVMAQMENKSIKINNAFSAFKMRKRFWCNRRLSDVK